MTISAIFLSGILLAAADVPPVPGLCTEPAAKNVGKPGCFLSAEVKIDAAPSQLYWHIYQFQNDADATSEAGRHRWSTVVRAHDRVWLYVMGSESEKVQTGKHQATIGPLKTPPGETVTARFLESTFPPGMQTRVHSHPGPEAFYVIDGEQCVETPTDRHKITPGTSYIVTGGPHLQSAPKGRRSVVVVIVPQEGSWMKLESGWTPTGFCDR